MSTVRTRFAPSPSGYLHIGGARTALFSHLFARHNGGTFVLRIEDTNREKSTRASIDAILDAMTWLRLDWDEGPFYQSRRADLHREHVDKLLSGGSAYRCYCTPDELTTKREVARAAGRNPVYDRTCRERSDTPTDTPFTVRFRAPIDGATVIADLVKGHVSFQNADLDDIILLRSDGSPTYNLSVTVDDATMEISHIIRGEDHLSNTPKQIQLYRALGFPEPKFAHLPLILGLDRTRLAKRHGATSVTAYRDMGYLPDGVVNYLARLGWSHGDDEIFSRDELIEKFRLTSVGTAAGVYDPVKAQWVNFNHLKSLKNSALVEAARPFFAATGLPVPSDDELAPLVEMLRERSNTLVEMAEGARFYLGAEIEIDPKAAQKHLRPVVEEPLRALRDGLAALTDWQEASLEAQFKQVTDRFEIKLGKVAQPVRVAVTGGTASPGIFEVVALLGKDRTIERLDRALEFIQRRADDANEPTRA